MSVLTSASGGAAGAASRSRVARALGSSIGLKIIMALTGVILSGYVLGHMAGNLQAFQGRASIDAYGKMLHDAPIFLWTARAVLLVAIGLHIWAFVVLTRRNMGARPHGYRALRPRESSFASRSMALTGPLLLAFIVYHILHMTTGTVHPDFEEGSVYHNLITGLGIWPVAFFYLAGLAALALHLWHGIWSLFQTLGVGQARYESLGRRFATGFTLVVVLGFAAIPICILAGILK
jgi:succinate dehydrogenase / fumarate reductase, cytochrome b subunit